MLKIPKRLLQTILSDTIRTWWLFLRQACEQDLKNFLAPIHYSLPVHFEVHGHYFDEGQPY
jgi:hypothetical protein